MSYGVKRLVDYLTQDHVNVLADAFENQNAIQHGRGVITGLVLEDGGDLLLDISSGSMIGAKYCVIPAQTAIDLPASEISYIWISEPALENGVVTVTVIQTTDDLGPYFVCLGTAETDADSIVGFTPTGRMQLKYWADPLTKKYDDDLIVEKIGVGLGLGKTPTAPLDVAGESKFEGVTEAGNHRFSVNVQTLTTTKILDANSPNVHVLTASGADRSVALPSLPQTYGDWFDFVNPATSSYNIVVKDANLVSTIATIPPGYCLSIAAVVNAAGNGPSWPASMTPVALPTPLS